MAAHQCLNCGQIEKDDCCENPDMFCINDMCEEIKRLRAELARSAIAAADQWLESPPTNQCGETCERAELRAELAALQEDLRYVAHSGMGSCAPAPAGWQLVPVEPTLAALIAIESAFAQKCADTWCTSRNAETLETARAAIAAAGGKVSRNTEPER